MIEDPNLALARAYLRAIEQGQTGSALAAFCDEALVQVEYPNPVCPNGITRDLAGVLASAERGQRVVEDQRFEVRDALASGDKVALRVHWSAVLKVPLGKSQVGERIGADFGVFMTMREGKIVEHHTYDCFAPF